MTDWRDISSAPKKAVIDQAEFWRCHKIIASQVGERFVPGSDEDIRFLTLGMAGEAGETANIVKKIWRDGMTDELMEKLRGELADTFAYGVLLATAIGMDITEAMLENREKIYRRWPATRPSPPETNDDA